MSERIPNTGELFTSRQKKLLDSELAKDKFRDTHDLFALVEQVRSKLGEGDDWIPKSVVLEAGIYMLSPNSVRFSVDVSSPTERIPIEVDIVTMVLQLPRHVMACLVHYDPASELEPQATPQDLCELKLKCKDFLEHMCNAVEVLICCFQVVLLIVDKRHDGRMTHADWLRFRHLLLRAPGNGEGDKSQLLSECVDMLNAYVCKVLGPNRDQFKRDFHKHSGNHERARIRLKTVMLMLLAVEKLTLVTAMEVNGIRTYSRLPAPTSDHFFHYLFQGRPQAYSCLTRILKFCSLLYRLLSLRCVTLHVNLPHEPGERFTAAEVASVDVTRKLTLLTALILEPLERLLQSRPMINVLESPCSDNLVADILTLAKNGMCMLSPDPDDPEKQIYSCAFINSADERTGKLHFPTRILDGDIELLVARAHMLCAHVTTHIGPALAKVGALTGQPQWWTTTSACPDWFENWMCCAYFTLSLASKVLTRRWPRDGEAFPEGKQPYEGQLSINAMRAAAAICQSGCRALVACREPDNPYNKVWHTFQVLTVAVRARLAMKDLAAMWCCGDLGRRLFCGEQFRVAPVSCKLRDAYGELRCFESVDMRPFIEASFPASEQAVEPGASKSRSKKQRQRPEDQMEVVLQACEMGVRFWQVFQGMVSLEVLDGGRFDDTEFAKMLYKLVDQFANPQKTRSEIWRRIGLRVQQNVSQLAEHARAVEAYVYRSKPEKLNEKVHAMDVTLQQLSGFLESRSD